MKFSVLRRIDKQAVKARAAMAQWPLHDHALTQKISYAPLPASALLVAVDAYRAEVHWRGYVDLAEWLTHTAPDVARLALGADGLQSPAHPDNVLRLFEASAQPLIAPLPALSYDQLRVRIPEEDRNRQDRFLSLMTSRGRIWFSDYPDIAGPVSPRISTSMRSIPLQIAWCLGNSNASRRLIKKLQPGDVLLIVNETFELSSAGQIIGFFSINEHGEILVQAAGYNETQRPDDVSESAEITVDTALSDIPLRLDFILQRSTMTVAQLDALYRGQVLPLDRHAEQKIDIVVNGVRIAKGELVELNGRLGVELHDITVGQHITETSRVQ